MKLCLLDAWKHNDPALLNSHWVADRTREALQTTFPDVVLAVRAGDAVDKACMEAVLAEAHDGFVYFGHGRESVLYRDKDASNPILRERDCPPIPIFEIHHLLSLGPRWFHAFACLSGKTLSEEALQAGAAVYVGYSMELAVEWDPERLPQELRDLLHQLVVVATIELARGQRSRRSLRVGVRNASERLLDWLDTHESDCAQIPWYELCGLQMLANRLHQNLEAGGIAIVP